MSVKVILTAAHAAQPDAAKMAGRLAEVQKIFDTNKFPFTKDTINFVFLSGNYIHTERSMIVGCVFVNKTDSDVAAFRGSLSLKFKKAPGEIATMHVDFPPEFIGFIPPDHGILVTLTFPVRGLDKNAAFMAPDIEGRFEDIELLKFTGAE